MLGISDYIRSNVNIEYVITYFQPNKSLPKKLYYDFGSQYPQSEKFNFCKYSFLTYDITDNKIQDKISKIINKNNFIRLYYRRARPKQSKSIDEIYRGYSCTNRN